MIQRDFLGRLAVVAALTLAVSVTGGAQANTVIWQDKDDFVRLEPAEGAKPAPGGNRVPVMSSDAVKAVLSSIKVTDGGGDEPFLTEDQIAELAKPVADALRSAGPSEDVGFAVHYVGSIMSMIGPRKMTAGRIFFDGDAVGVIIGMVQESYTRDVVVMDPKLIRTGSRVASQQTSYRILPNSFVQLAQNGRGDWARVSPAVWTGYGAQPMAMAPSMPASPAYAPAPAAASMPMAAPMPAEPSNPGLEERFAILKRLYDNHLITEAEYEKSKASLLQGITGSSPR